MEFNKNVRGLLNAPVLEAMTPWFVNLILNVGKNSFVEVNNIVVEYYKLISLFFMID